MPQLAAQRCGRLVVSLQLLQRYPRRRAQLVVDAAQGHGDARVEHVAQLHEDDSLHVAVQLGQSIRPRFAALPLGAVGSRGILEQRDAGVQLRRGQLLKSPRTAPRTSIVQQCVVSGGSMLRARPPGGDRRHEGARARKSADRP